MNCPACGAECREGAKFCGSCQHALAAPRRCSACGAENPPGQRFCDECGEPLAAASSAPPSTTRSAPDRSPRAYTPRHLADQILASRAALEGERKQVTVLFADVKGSLELAEQAGAEEWHAILDRFFAILTSGVHRFEGTVNQYTGDGIMALFGAPLAHEDHAQRACYAALHLRDALRGFAEELKRTRGIALAARFGLNSGEVVVGKIGDDLRMDYTAQGPVVGIAQRMEALADPGRIYVAATTAQLAQGYFALRDLGEFALKSVSAPQRVYELEGVGAAQSRFDVSRARGLSRFVGRGDELATLEAALARAASGQGSVIGVVAEPGTGKSRLCFELAERARARGLPVRMAHGVPHGRQLAYLPVLALLRGLFGIHERDGEAEARQKIAGALVLLDASFERALPIWFDFLSVADAARPAPALPPAERERVLLEGLRRIVRARSERGPGLIVLEDLHWFDEASERVLATLVETVAGTRVLLLVNFRPEFRAEWTQRSGYQQLPLLPLGEAALRELLAALLGPDRALAPLAERIAKHAGGNPFFVEELVQALAEDGSLTGSRGGYQVAQPIEALTLPATVQAVLAARIDRLAEREKRVAQAAAVIGPEFDLRVLARVAELPEPELVESLRALAQAEIAVERSLYPEVVYGFKHPLTQEVALRSQLAARRAARHAATARALEELTPPEKRDEQAALLAQHWDEAGEKGLALRAYARAGEHVGMQAPRSAFHHWSRVRELSLEVEETSEVLELRLSALGFLVTAGFSIGEPIARLRGWLDEARECVRRGGSKVTFMYGLASYAISRAAGDIDFREALSAVREASALAAELNDEVHHAQLGFSRFFVEREAGLLREALATSERIPSNREWFLAHPPHRDFADTPLRLYASRIANHARVLFLLGRHAEAAPAIDEAIEIDTEMESTGGIIWRLFRIDLAAFRGDAAAAMRDAAALGGRGRAESAHDPRMAAATMGLAQLAAGAWADALDSFDRGESFGYGNEFVRHRRAEALLGLGRLDEARSRALASAADLARRDMPIQELEAQLVLARVLRRADGAPARAAIEAALARAEALIAQTGAALWAPELHRERAALAKLLGDAAAHARELREALRLFGEMGAPLRVAEIERELAEATRSEEAST